MVIIKKENSEIRLVTEQTVALEEKIINGVKCYIPVGNDDYDGETISLKNHHCMLVEIYGHFYAYDENEEGGKTKDIYSFTNKSVIEHKYDYLELKKVSNKWYAYGYNHLGIRKGIYLFEHNIWIEAERNKYKSEEEEKEYLEEPKEFFNKQYIYYKREDGTDIDIYDIEKQKWIKASSKVDGIYKIVQGVFLNQIYAYVIKQQEENISAIYGFDKEIWYYSLIANFVKLVQVAGQSYVYEINKDGRSIGIVDKENKIYTSYDSLELKEIDGKTYAYDIGEGKVHAIYSFQRKRWIKKHWDHLEVVNGFQVCDINTKGEIKRVYTLEGDKYIVADYESHFKIANKVWMIYLCDSQGKIRKIYQNDCSEYDI